MVLTRSNVRLFHFEADHHETHVPTFRRQAQAHARFPRPDEERGRPESTFRAAREGPGPARALIDRRAAAMLRGSRRSRLTGIGAFDTVFRNGRRREGEFLQMICMPAARQHGRFGIVIGKKALPLAVDRNRVRRMLRVCVRDARPGIDGYDLVVRLKKGARRMEFRSIAKEAARLLAAFAPASQAS
jgi:ribonuclease P protein component